MLKDQCISVTDLRTKTKECMEDLQKGEKYIFVNNKPRAVLMDIDDYERRFGGYHLKPLPANQSSEALQKMAKKTRAMNSAEFLNL